MGIAAVACRVDDQKHLAAKLAQRLGFARLQSVERVIQHCRTRGVAGCRFGGRSRRRPNERDGGDRHRQEQGGESPHPVVLPQVALPSLSGCRGQRWKPPPTITRKPAFLSACPGHFPMADTSGLALNIGAVERETGLSKDVL